jgi:phosphomannomutase
MVRELEAQTAAGTDPCLVSDVTGATADCGARPRLLIMAEESGGAAMGPAEPMTSRSGVRSSLAAKEKDAMQLGAMALCLAARLHTAGGSFAGYYMEQLARWETRYRFYERRDVTLFDESLQGEERVRAQAAGNRRKEATVAFFAGLETLAPEAATRVLIDAMPAGSALPTIERIFHAGDGTYLEFSGQWFELRASGTDAVLRYYMEGADRAAVAELNEAFTRLDLPAFAD